jgi:hypothetical protein
VVSARTARSLALALAPLSTLQGWSRVEMLVERVLDALRGVEGLDQADVRLVMLLSQRWVEMPEAERGFLAGLLRAEGTSGVAARLALGHLLEGRPARLEPWARGVLSREWLAIYGVDPRMSGATLWRS